MSSLWELNVWVLELFPILFLWYIKKSCSMNNKNPKIDIGVQAEDLKSKTAKPLEKSYFYQGLMTADWAWVP